MNDAMTALSVHLATLAPSPDGWLRIDRDRMAADLGIGRIQLARLLTKAEGKIGIQIQGDRAKYLNNAEIKSRENKVDIPKMLAAVSELMQCYDMETSQSARSAMI